MEKLSDEFRSILDDPHSTERDVHRFLKEYPHLMIDLFNVSWNYKRVVSEFQLGNAYRADFLVLSADSGRWHAVLIELEGPHDRLYLKNGTPSEKLRVAQQQVKDWEHYVRSYQPEVRRTIAAILKEEDVCAQNLLMGKSGCRAHDEILHQEVYLNFQYKIVMGRRATFQDEPRNHMPGPGFGYDLDVSSYDRVVDRLMELEDRIGHAKLRTDLRRNR